MDKKSNSSQTAYFSGSYYTTVNYMNLLQLELNAVKIKLIFLCTCALESSRNHNFVDTHAYDTLWL